jgi:hypothetical protein
VNVFYKLTELWRRLNAALQGKASEASRNIRKAWRRSWVGRVAWPWLRKELEIVLKVSGVIVLSLWAKRLVEQFLGARIVNERILQGELNSLVQEIEQDVSTRRSHGHRRTK